MGVGVAVGVVGALLPLALALEALLSVLALEQLFAIKAMLRNASATPIHGLAQCPTNRNVPPRFALDNIP